MQKPILYIFAGANGSGKTTIAKLFTEKLKIPFINADEIAASMDGRYETAIVSAGRDFLKQIDKRIKKGKPFAIESTLSGKTIGNLIKKANSEGFNVNIVYMFLHDPSSNIGRIKTRVTKGGHHVSDKDVLRRFYRSKKQFWNTYRLLCQNWVLLYNSSERLVSVATGNKESITIVEKDLYNLYLEQVNEEN